VRLWTNGHAGWSTINDILLAVWLPITVLVRSHLGLVGLTKAFRFLRYVYFVEGLFFVVTAMAVLPVGGVTAMIGMSIVSSSLFTVPYGLARTARFFAVPWTEIAFGWQRESFRLALVLLPLAAASWWLTRPLPDSLKMLAHAVILGLPAMALLWLIGFPEELRREILSRIPRRFGWVRGLLAPRSPTTT
jgi:hypothetical protein